MQLSLGLGLNKPVYNGVQPSAISDLIAANDGDITVLIVGDGTSDGAADWPRLFFSKAYVPTHTVEFHAWNDGSNVYSAPVVLSSGTGPHSIHIYNASVALARGQYFCGAKFAPAIAAITADVIIFNIGITHVTGSDILSRGELMAAVAQIHAQHPDARLFAIKQNPNRDSTVMTALVAQWDTIASLLPGLTLVDVHQAFLDLSKAASLYADVNYPSAAGIQLYVEAFKKVWFAGPTTTSTPWLDATASSLFAGYNFAAWTPPAVPTGWAEVPATLVEDKELTIKQADESFSVELFDNGAVGFVRLAYPLTAPERAAVLSQTVTLWSWVYVPVGMPSGAGVMSLVYNGASAATIQTRAETQGRGGWRLICIPGVAVPADPTNITIALYYDTGVPSVADNVYWARRVRFHLGATPKEVGVAE